jgi:tetratricopeptide (TPR) repeat protein
MGWINAAKADREEHHKTVSQSQRIISYNPIHQEVKMTPTPIPTAAAVSTYVDVNWVIAIATIAATIGTLIGVIIAQRQSKKAQLARQKEDLDKQVSKEVEAKIGIVYMNLRTLEGEARQQLADLIAQLEFKQKQLTSEIEEREKTLKEIVERSSAQAETIENLLQRASALIPTIADAEVIPIQLFFQAGKAEDASKKTTLLFRVLDHPDSDPKVLEWSGDMARQQLNNTKLAERLYGRALEIDPDNVTSKAEYLHLMALHAAERPKAQQEIIELARKHPNNAVVINNLVNFFIEVDDYDTLAAIAAELLPQSKEKALLWRNIAVARSELGRPHEEIIEAYEKAFEHADEGDYVNTARPYVRYLLRRVEGAKAEQVLIQALKAEQILIQALRFVPSEASLHMLKADLHRSLGQYDKAREGYEWVRNLGDQREVFVAESRIRDLAIIEQMGLVPSSSEGSSEGE